MRPTLRRTQLALTLFVILAGAALAAAQDAPPRRSALVRQRLETRPNDPTLHFYLAMFEIAEGNRAAGIAALREVARIGHGFLPGRFGFDSVMTDTAFLSVRTALERQLPRVTDARELFRLDRRLIPEGIAHDPTTGSYFVGSVAESKVVRVDAKGAANDLSKPGELHQVLGLAVDPERRLLHVVSTTGITPAEGRAPVNRIVSYDLTAGAATRTRTIDVPGAAQLNDVAVSKRGDLYVTDSQGAAVYRIRNGAAAADTLIAPGTLGGPNGLVVAPGDSILYVAHSTGVARMRLADGVWIPRLDLPPGETVAAIDGLYADGNTLIGIQNVTNPGRVIRVHLDPTGTKATRIETLLSHHHPAIDEPTTGVIVGRTFAFLATTQVARFNPDGTITEPATLKPPIVLGLDLDAERN
jgi:sugar lactone lactonase YvrE